MGAVVKEWTIGWTPTTCSVWTYGQRRATEAFQAREIERTGAWALGSACVGVSE